MFKTDRAIDLVQVLTSIAVIIGLGLVVWELQLSRTLTRAQIGSDHFAEQLANRRALLGENPVPAIVKACVSPKELTPAERTIALAHIDLSYDLISRMKILNEVGDFDIPWEEFAADGLRLILGTPIGRYDYETYRESRWDPDLWPIADQILENNEQVKCEGFWSEFEEWLDRNDA